MTTTRTAAEALEKLIRLERNLEKKCHDLGYYNMIHVGLREFVEHAETFRAALAPPQEGEAEELARRFEAYADDADQHALLMVPIGAETLRHATRLLRATQSNGHSPVGDESPRQNAKGAEGCHDAPNASGESPAQSAPAQEPVGEYIVSEAGVRGVAWNANVALPSARGPLYAAPPPPAPAQEPVATLEAKVSTLLARALTTGYGSTEAIYALANLAREPLFAAPPPPPAQEPVDVAASSIRNGSTNKGDKMINYTGRHKDSFDRFFASTQKEKPVGWRKDLNPPHGNFTLQWLEENPWPEQNHVQPLYAAPPQPLTDAQIVEIRDDHLPSQGEPFDCIAFARAILRAASHEHVYCPHCRPCKHSERVDAYDSVLRGLASYLSAGGFNSTGLIDPQEADAKIRWGIDNFVKVDAARLLRATQSNPVYRDGHEEHEEDMK